MKTVMIGKPLRRENRLDKRILGNLNSLIEMSFPKSPCSLLVMDSGQRSIPGLHIKKNLPNRLKERKNESQMDLMYQLRQGLESKSSEKDNH